MPSSRWRKALYLNISQIYAPTSAYSESESDSFYDILQLHIEKILRKESAIGMGDLNAKVGADHKAWTPSMDKYGLGKANSRGDNLLVFCTLHKLAVCNAYYVMEIAKIKLTTLPPS